MEKVEIKVFNIDRNVDMAIVMGVPTERLHRRSFQLKIMILFIQTEFVRIFLLS